MAIDCILAMTPGEIQANDIDFGNIGWLSCRFSHDDTGLTNLPGPMPPDSLLILDDSHPLDDHAPGQMLSQLREILTAGSWIGLLLDFQRPENPKAAELAKVLTASLPCPVAVSDQYAQELNCPVFLPPVPPDTPLSAYLHPWKGREIWLDIAPTEMEILLTPQGATATFPSKGTCPLGTVHADPELHCHYSVEATQDYARFRLFRTEEDLVALIGHAEEWGVSKFVGLWQELGEFPAFSAKR